MREPLKSMLKNLPKGLFFNEEENDLYAFCEDCKKKITYEIRQRNIKDGLHYCRNCAQKHKVFSKDAKANIADGAKKRTGPGLCANPNCPNKNKIMPYRSASGLCKDCQASSSKKIVLKSKSSGMCTNPYCDRYNKYRDQNGRGRDIGYGDGEWIADYNIVDKNSGKIIVYKGQKCGCNCSQQFYIEHNNEDFMIKHSLENLDKINEHHIEFCDKCDKETVHNGYGTCLVCNPNTGSIKRLIEKDGILLYWDSNLGKYVDWNQYSENFKLEILNTNVDFLKKAKSIYSKAEMITTFREQDSDSWLNAKIPFEQSLLDKNITYFTYVKFYLNENNIPLPIVSGSSASKIINIKGSDVNFSENIEDGPARRLIKSNNYQWDKTKILIIPFNNKNDSLLAEQLLKDRFNLFGS